MSVVGLDFGNFNSYVAVARHGGIDVLTNDYSLRATPSCVAFGKKSRIMGVAARQQVNTNLQNTVLNFKHLLGRKFSDPVTQFYKKFVPCEMIEMADGSIGLVINFGGETRVLAPEQVMAAFFVKMKQITEDGLSSKVKEFVASVPFYFSANQRLAVQAAGKIAGLNLLDIVDENSAVGIAYGMYNNSSLPLETEPKKLVAFVDIGHSCMQASVMAFNCKQVEILCANYDLQIGGLFFDDLIRDFFHAQFLEKFKVDAKKSPKAWLRLLDESEKAKKQMSASTTNVPISIECFLDDKDVAGSINRVQFEEMAKPIFEKIFLLLIKLLADAEQLGIKMENFDEVELIGGSSRIPRIKQIVGECFKREPKTTMDLDEAVARGAAMRGAIISPTTKTKEFSVITLTKSDEKSDDQCETCSPNVEECIKIEDEMQAIDWKEKLTADAKNTLEEYCYNMRDKLPLSSFVKPEELTGFLNKLSETEQWLYDEGEFATSDVYAQKLADLRSFIDVPIQQRQEELEKKKHEELEKEKRQRMEEKYRKEQAERKEDASQKTVDGQEVEIELANGIDEPEETEEEAHMEN